MEPEIWFDAVQPDESRRWYRHCYGLRGHAWAVHGYFERVYYVAPDYVDGVLRKHLESALVTLWAVISSEIRAAIDTPIIGRFSAAANEYVAHPDKRSLQRAEEE